MHWGHHIQPLFTLTDAAFNHSQDGHATGFQSHARLIGSFEGVPCIGHFTGDLGFHFHTRLLDQSEKVKIGHLYHVPPITPMRPPQKKVIYDHLAEYDPFLHGC